MKSKLYCLMLLSVIAVFFASFKTDETAKKAEKGTYQIQFKKGGDQAPVSLTSELLQKIEKSRSQSEVVYLDYVNYKIMILPYSAINSAGFKPVVDYIIMH